ncbi:RNA-directed DNA polymerase [Paenarthrobacter sp. OM7]|nr:antiviral reverse transcriptase Drt3b [Paenarthrobacter sp. OM7]WGM22692.1 RNA-directed DNA polymerase [Paenarthrobacter sp. OM7]
MANVTSVEDIHTSDPILRSFFRYHRYSNLYKFYDSPEYLSLESEYSQLIRLDITQCFNSIYTHSMAWATVGKHQAKLDRSSKSFGNEFDQLMQRANHGQTNGLLVGPESSRVFAEVILQDVDKRVEQELIGIGLFRGRDYEIRRYVDDYFVFTNSIEAGTAIKLQISSKLRNINLRLNESKESVFSTPHITSISIAKSAIVKVLENGIPSSLTLVQELQTIPRAFEPTKVIFDYKSAVSLSGCRHDDVVNFSLAVAERRVAGLVRSLRSAATQSEVDDQIAVGLLLGAVEITQFLYGTSLRVATTIKICRILGHVLNATDEVLRRKSSRVVIKDAIASILKKCLKRPSSVGQPGVERLYLLTTLHSLGRAWLLSSNELEAVLRDSFRANKGPGGTEVMDYFTATSLLHYMEARHRYEALRLRVVNACLAQIVALPHNAAERAMLSVDLLACPYVSYDIKEQVMNIHDVPNDSTLRHRLAAGVFSFTQWARFDLQSQLELKRNSEAY